MSAASGSVRRVFRSRPEPPAPVSPSGGRRRGGFTIVLLGALVGAAAPARAAEVPSAQARIAHAEFLSQAPPPEQPVAVCVIDTGVDLTTDAAPAVVQRLAYDGGTPDDLGGVSGGKHGTYVAGIIASQVDGKGSAGIWPHAKIVSVRVFPGGTQGTTADAYIQAIHRCLESPHRVKVINLSLGGIDQESAQLPQLENKIQGARTIYGVNVVAAAGNGGGSVGYPARFPTTFAIGGTDVGDAFCWFSNRGDGLDISTLGCDVELSMGGGALGLGRGTSFAAPIMSGALAALRAYKPELTVDQAEQLVLTTARSAPAGKFLDAAALFRSAGLGPMVDTYQPPPPSAPNGELVVVSDTGPNPFAALRPRKPALRSLRRRGRSLVLRLRHVHSWSRVVVQVGLRRFKRRGARVKVPAKRWRRLVVWVVEPGIGRSEPLIIRRRR